jgi:hypothetical protein
VCLKKASARARRRPADNTPFAKAPGSQPWIDRIDMKTFPTAGVAGLSKKGGRPQVGKLPWSVFWLLSGQSRALPDGQPEHGPHVSCETATRSRWHADPTEPVRRPWG